MLETQSEARFEQLFEIVVLNSQTLKHEQKIQFPIRELYIKREDIKNDPQMILYKKGKSREGSEDLASS